MTSVSTAAAEGNGLAATPPMGWNDWYSSVCGVNAQLVEQTAQAMVANGMQAAGYDYVNIDDCWMAPSRDSAGNLVADPTRFPGGIKPVADYVHSLGMKLGIYEDAGTLTCAHLPGSYGHEAQDAADFAAWGVDFVKYDRCSIPYSDFPGQSEEQVQQTLYTRMSNALKATGRPILFSMANPDPGDDPWAWGGPIANMWRTTSDIEDNFGAMLQNFEGTVGLYRDAGPGAWNDPDLLQIGNGGSTLTEYRTEFSLWAEMAAPLIASTNIAALTPDTLAIYENRSVIAVDQDPLGEPGVPVSSSNGLWVLTKKLSDGDRSVVLFNSTNTAATITTKATAVGLPARPVYRLDDVWTGAATQTRGAISAFVPGHGAAMFIASAPTSGRPRSLPPQTVLALTSASGQLNLGRSTTVSESFTNTGVAPVKRLRMALAVPSGWRVTRLGRAPTTKVAPGRRVTVAYRVTAPWFSSPLAISLLSGRAKYDPPAGAGTATATLGETVAPTVSRQYRTANVTTHPASFSQFDNDLAISTRGLGVYNPPSGGPPTDSYAAIYERARARTSSVAQVTVTSDPSGGVAGAAGLIERNSIAAPRGSPAGVALYVNCVGVMVMAWNASGGVHTDSHYLLKPNIVHVPVTLRLVRSGSTYTGYFSTNGGVTWLPVDTVSVAPGASAGTQDVGVFHASGLDTWTTTATFRDFNVN